MSVRSVGALARERRGLAGPTRAAAAAPADSTSGLSRFEESIPTEVIVFYTAVIAACEAVLADNPEETFRGFRIVIYALALAATAYATGRVLISAVGRWGAVVKTPEWWTAVLAFAAWGLALPGSFLYVWLDTNVLAVTVATITATAGLLLAVVLSPKLNTSGVAAPAAPTLTDQPPPGTFTDQPPPGALTDQPPPGA